MSDDDRHGERATASADRARPAARHASAGARADDDLRDTIEEMIEEARREPPSAIGAQERTLLRNIFKLRELTADDVMVPRADIVAVEADVRWPSWSS